MVTAAAEFSAPKGMATLAAAAAALPEVAFVFLGGTERSRAWLRRSASFGSNVHLPGFVKFGFQLLSF